MNANETTKEKVRVLKVSTAWAKPWKNQQLFDDVDDLDAIVATQNYRLLKRKRVDKLKREILEDGMRSPVLLEYRKDKEGSWQLFCRQGHHRLQAVKELRAEKSHVVLRFKALVQFNATGESTTSEDIKHNEVEANSIIDRAMGWQHLNEVENQTYEQIGRAYNVDPRTVARTVVIAKLPEKARERLNDNLDELKENTVKELARNYVRDLGEDSTPETEATACKKLFDAIEAEIAKRQQDRAARKQRRSSNDDANQTGKDGPKKKAEDGGNVETKPISPSPALDADREGELKVTAEPAAATGASTAAVRETTEQEAPRLDAALEQAPPQAAAVRVVSQPASVEATAGGAASQPASAEKDAGNVSPAPAPQKRKPRAAAAATAALKYRQETFDKLCKVVPPETYAAVAEVLELPAAVKAAIRAEGTAESA